MILLYKLCTFLQRLYVAVSLKINRGQKVTIGGGGRGLSWGYLTKMFSKIPLNKKQEIKTWN
jgi:hypothetical protein